MGARQTLRLIALFCLGLSVPATSNQAFSQTSSSEAIDLIRAETADTISFQEKVAFISPTGEEITSSIGTYRVEPVGPSALRLVPFEGKEPIVINAKPTRHDEDLPFPVALIAVDDEYLIHVVLLLPEHKGLEAIGFSSRGRYRGLPELLSAAQLHEVFGQKKATRAPQSPP